MGRRLRCWLLGHRWKITRLVSHPNNLSAKMDKDEWRCVRCFREPSLVDLARRRGPIVERTWRYY